MHLNEAKVSQTLPEEESRFFDVFLYTAILAISPGSNTNPAVDLQMGRYSEYPAGTAMNNLFIYPLLNAVLIEVQHLVSLSLKWFFERG